MRSTPKHPILAVLGAAFLSTTFTACSSSCTDIGCIEAVTVSFSHPVSQAGAYIVDLGADATHLKCTITLPAHGSASCDDPRAYVFVDSAGALTFASVDGRIKSLAVTVLRDGTEVASGTFQPAYQGVELNGPGCGTCSQATETLTTP
jgi:hypothetical protein